MSDLNEMGGGCGTHGPREVCGHTDATCPNSHTETGDEGQSPSTDEARVESARETEAPRSIQDIIAELQSIDPKEFSDTESFRKKNDFLYLRGIDALKDRTIAYMESMRGVPEEIKDRIQEEMSVSYESRIVTGIPFALEGFLSKNFYDDVKNLEKMKRESFYQKTDTILTQQERVEDAAKRIRDAHPNIFEALSPILVENDRDMQALIKASAEARKKMVSA